MTSILPRMLDLLLMSFVLGATAWFFFIQSPALIRLLGRPQFVALQMRMIRIYFMSIVPALYLSAVASWFIAGVASHLFMTSLMAALAASVNAWVILPRALRAGKESQRASMEKGATLPMASFASEGARQETKVFHRLIVLIVGIMLVLVLGHGFHVIGGGA